MSSTGVRHPAAALSSGVAALTAGLVLAAPGWMRLAPIPGADLGVRWTDQRIDPDVLRVAATAHVQALILVVAGIAALVSLLGLATRLAGDALGRRREVAVRAALGAHGRRLVAPLVREGAGRLCAGAGLGGLAGAVGSAAARASWPGLEAEPIPGTALAMGAVIAFAGLLLALPLLALPARAASGPLTPLLATADRATADRFEGWGRRFLAGAQLTVTLALLAGGLTVVRTGTLEGTRHTRAESTPRVVVLPLAANPDSPRDWSRLMRELGALPGIRPRAVASPGSFVGLGTSDFTLADCGSCSAGGFPTPFVGARPRIHSVSRDFFDTAGLALLEGRGFTDADGPGADPVVILSRSFATRFYFEDGRAVGRIVRVGGSPERWYRVIGVVEDAQVPVVGRTDRPRPALYLSALQHPPSRVELAIGMAAEGKLDAVARATAAAGFAAMGEPRTLAELREEEAAPLRWWGRAIAGLALLATLLSVASVHAVARQEGEAKRREIAVRRAIGAPPRAIVRAAAAAAVRTWAIATVLALPGAIAVAAAFDESAAGVPTFDLPLYLAVSLALLGTMLVGSAGPILEATRIDPLEALKG